MDKLLEENPKNHEVLLIKGNLCYLTNKYYESEDTYLRLLKVRTSKSLKIYLRLGYMYLKRKSWIDAKTVLQKASEINN